jgi:hypothetical protein
VFSPSQGKETAAFHWKTWRRRVTGNILTVREGRLDQGEFNEHAGEELTDPRSAAALKNENPAVETVGCFLLSLRDFGIFPVVAGPGIFRILKTSLPSEMQKHRNDRQPDQNRENDFDGVHRIKSRFVCRLSTAHEPDRNDQR